MAAAPQAIKLPLGIRKGVRDEFESRVPGWGKRLSDYAGLETPYQIEVDASQLFAYTTKEHHKHTFGHILRSYFSHFVDAVQKYTKEGADPEAQNFFRMVAPKTRVTMRANDGQYDILYCMVKVVDGSFVIFFNPERFAVNIEDIGYDQVLAATIDSAVVLLDLDVLPLTLSRIARKDLDANIDKYKQDLHTIFGQSVAITYNLRQIRDIVHLPEYRNKYGLRFFPQEGALDREIPGEIDNYLRSAIFRLKSLSFSYDTLYREEWLAAAPKGILFEVVPRLETVSSVYNQVR